MKYNVIYADPPWKLKAGRAMNGYKIVEGKQIWNSENTKTRELEFPTMSIQEICALPVERLTAPDAHLYIWATNNTLPSVFKIIYAWGFDYSTTLVWAKNRMGGGLGGTFRISTEFLIFATKGRLKAKQNIGNTWFNVKREYENGYPKHSKKPTFFHELIESVSPGNKLELFARAERDGWDVFGNEVPNSITL